jgi:hypothetical protein
MLKFAGPHMATIAGDYFVANQFGAVARICGTPQEQISAAVRDGRVAAKAPRSRGHPALQWDCFGHERQNRGDAVSPLLQRRQCPSCGIRRTGAGWSEKTSRPSDVIASTHPWMTAPGKPRSW